MYTIYPGSTEVLWFVHNHLQKQLIGVAEHICISGRMALNWWSAVEEGVDALQILLDV